MYKRRLNFCDIIVWSFGLVFFTWWEWKEREREIPSPQPSPLLFYMYSTIFVVLYQFDHPEVWWNLFTLMNMIVSACQGLNISYNEPEIHSTCWSCTNSLPFLCIFLLWYKHARVQKFWLVPLLVAVMYMYCTAAEL